MNRDRPSGNCKVGVRVVGHLRVVVPTATRRLANDRPPERRLCNSPRDDPDSWKLTSGESDEPRSRYYPRGLSRHAFLGNLKNIPRRPSPVAETNPTFRVFC